MSASQGCLGRAPEQAVVHVVDGRRPGGRRRWRGRALVPERRGRRRLAARGRPRVAAQRVRGRRARRVPVPARKPARCDLVKTLSRPQARSALALQARPRAARPARARARTRACEYYLFAAAGPCQRPVHGPTLRGTRTLRQLQGRAGRPGGGGGAPKVHAQRAAPVQAQRARGRVRVARKQPPGQQPRRRHGRRRARRIPDAQLRGRVGARAATGRRLRVRRGSRGLPVQGMGWEAHAWAETCTLRLTWASVGCSMRWLGGHMTGWRCARAARKHSHTHTAPALPGWCAAGGGTACMAA